MTTIADTAVAQKWVDALRSGEYSQARGVLAEDDANGNRSYCCLGVLSELAAQEGLIPPAEVQRCGFTVEGEPCDAVGHHTIRYKNDSGMPPPEVKAWLLGESPELAATVEGREELVNRYNWEVDPPKGWTGRTRLDKVNDSGEFDFNAIADLVEAEFLTDAEQATSE